MASPHLAEQVGRVLDGRYRVIAPIGTGASAAVYLADDTTLRRRVALKVLHAGLASDQGFLKRFEAEAHTAAALSHPNIMRVLDWGEGHDGPFLVLEYLGGGSLRTLFDNETRLSPSQAVQIGIQAARALDYAHRRGLVHRDIKPANLLFDDEGRLTIADFGLARALAEAAWTEPGGAMLGTARYAAPEQVKGLSLDGKADAYALGLVLYEAVTGVVPFTADTTIATLMARLDAHISVPDELGELGPVVQAAMHPDSTMRISAGEMLRALESAAITLPIPERLTLPGAIPIDIDRAVISDPTLLPGLGEPNPTVSVEARPLPPEVRPRRRLLRRRHNELSPATAAAISAQNGEKSKRRRVRKPSVKQAVVGFVIVALLAAASGSAYALYYFTGSQHPVPELVGLTREGAESAAQQADIKLVFDGEKFSEDIPTGQTFEQSPAPGTEIYPRQAAHVSISKGPAPRKVPAVVGQTWTESVRNLEAERFRVARQDRSDEEIPNDQVIEQSPGPGTELARDSEVTLVVSTGPRPRVVPDVKGKSREEAASLLTQQQLNVVFREEFDNGVENGRVISTAPGIGGAVPRDSTVNVTVSKGPEPITVPNVVGQSIDAAAAAITSAGLTPARYGPPSGGSVLKMTPGSGAVVKRGTQVELVYG